MIKEFRITRGWTQQKLADATGFSQPTICKHERNEEKDCHTCILIRHSIHQLADRQRKIECYQSAYKLAPMKMVVGKTLTPTKRKSTFRRLCNVIKHILWR